MTEPNAQPQNRIDQINTEYSKIVRVLETPIGSPVEDSSIADGSAEDNSATRARQQQLEDRERFIHRYEKAIKAFIGKRTGNPNKVEDIWSLFLEKCLGGKLCHYDPSIGSFRFYLKKVLRTTCLEFERQRSNQKFMQMDTHWGASIESEDIEAESEFDRNLAESLFEKALESIRKSDPVYHFALSLITRNIAIGQDTPDSGELAEAISEFTGKPVSRESARQIKSRASRLFANNLIEEVSDLIGSTVLDEVEEALIEIGILKYCKIALVRKRNLA